MSQIIAILGPTGVGKTKLSLVLAKQLNAEIISCDSMQFYRGLDIGTAKIKESEREGIKHHLIDILDPDEEFSVAKYQEIVRKKITELFNKNIPVILVGGSGLYISSVLYDYRFIGDKHSSKTEEKYKNYSLLELEILLRELSPELADDTDLKNRRRVLRSLEKVNLDFKRTADNLYYKNAILIGLDMKRELLYKRIDLRVEEMFNKGLLEEVKELYEKYPLAQSSKAIGYKELFKYFTSEITISEAKEEIKRNSRRYAKRQLTWFRNKMNCIWFNVDSSNFDNTINEIINYIQKQKK